MPGPGSTPAAAPFRELTALLRAMRDGDAQAEETLVTLVYPELRKLAGHYLRLERRGHTLETTALVHEAYLRVFRGGDVCWQDRSHFFALAARQMRRILVDHARRRGAAKNPAGRVRVEVEELREPARAPLVDLLALDEALERLEALDPRAARGVELRYFAGLHEAEAAEVLGVSLATLKRDWTFAKAFVLKALGAAR